MCGDLLEKVVWRHVFFCFSSFSLVYARMEMLFCCREGTKMNLYAYVVWHQRRHTSGILRRNKERVPRQDGDFVEALAKERRHNIPSDTEFFSSVNVQRRDEPNSTMASCFHLWLAARR